MPSLDTSRFLEDLTAYRVRNYTEALDALLFATIRGNRAQQRDARDRLADVIRETMGACEVLGATIMLRRAAAWLPDSSNFAARDKHHLLVFAETPTQTVLPRVTFAEAVQDMVERTPVTLQPAALRTSLRISELYAQGDVIAFVRSAEQAVTERVQSLYVKALSEGWTEAQIGKLTPKVVDYVRKETGPWTEAYSRMAFRTNANTAITAGRFRQAQDQDIQQVIPAFQFQSAGDSDVRGNHKACDGRIYVTGNAIWHKIAPPLGYNCRCDAVEMGRPLLKRMSRIRPDGSVIESSTTLPAGAGPDGAPFLHAGRPDLFMSATAGR